MTAQYTEDTQTTEQRRVQSIAETFTPAAQMEAIRRLQKDDPATYRTLPPALRLAFGFYLEGEAAARVVQAS